MVFPFEEEIQVLKQKIGGGGGLEEEEEKLHISNRTIKHQSLQF